MRILYLLVRRSLNILVSRLSLETSGIMSLIYSKNKIMNQQQSKSQVRRGRIFPEITISSKEQAKKEAELEAFHQRCRPIFERLRSQLIENHYNWFIVIEPNSEDYFIALDSMTAIGEALEKHPHGIFCTFRLNETGVGGRI